jgi:SSS family solute:Na+ symporter
MDLSFLASSGFAIANAEGVYEIPFLDRMGFVFAISIIGMVLISLVDNRRGVKPNALIVERSMFRMSSGFAVGALIVCGILAALYTVYW